MDATHAADAELIRRLETLERELSDVQARVGRLFVGQPLPGVYLVVDAAGMRALLPAVQVREIVRLVECAALPTSESWLLGSFLYRGTAHLAVDLAGFLGRPRTPPLDAHMVVLGCSSPLALVVDAVRNVVGAPVLAAAHTQDRAPGTPASVAICSVDGEQLPVLDLAAIVRRLGGGAP